MHFMGESYGLSGTAPCIGLKAGEKKDNVKLKFNSHIRKKLQYQIVILAKLSFGTTFSGYWSNSGRDGDPGGLERFPGHPLQRGSEVVPVLPLAQGL
jgi:hypothetical protein